MNMRWHKQVRISREGLDLAAEVNAAIVVNSDEPDADRTADASSHVRIVQNARSGRTADGQRRGTDAND